MRELIPCFDSFEKMSVMVSVKINYNKRLQVAYTHAHAYVWAPVPQGSQWYFGALYIPDVTIGYVTLVVAACVVTNQSRSV